MFKPNFSYTDRIIKNLTKIAEARAIILNAPLVPKCEVSLRRDALLRNTHSSTVIEGNPLSLEEVTALAEGREIMVKRKDKQEVLNYLHVLSIISEYAEKSEISIKDPLEIHKLITKETLENPIDEGVFRDHQVAVGNRYTGKVIFMPPPTPRAEEDRRDPIHRGQEDRTRAEAEGKTREDQEGIDEQPADRKDAGEAGGTVNDEYCRILWTFWGGSRSGEEGPGGRAK